MSFLYTHYVKSQCFNGGRCPFHKGCGKGVRNPVENSAGLTKIIMLNEMLNN